MDIKEEKPKLRPFRNSREYQFPEDGILNEVKDPQTPPERLAEIYRMEFIDYGQILLYNLLSKNPNTPSEILGELYLYDEYIKTNILYDDEYGTISMYLAGNPSTPKDVMMKLADVGIVPSTELLENPNCPFEVLMKLTFSKNEGIRNYAAKRIQKMMES